MVPCYYVHLYQVIPGHSSLLINGISNMSQMWTCRCVAGIGGAGFCGSDQMAGRTNSSGAGNHWEWDRWAGKYAERTQADSPTSNWYITSNNRPSVKNRGGKTNKWGYKQQWQGLEPCRNRTCWTSTWVQSTQATATACQSSRLKGLWSRIPTLSSIAVLCLYHCNHHFTLPSFFFHPTHPPTSTGTLPPPGLPHVSCPQPPWCPPRPWDTLGRCVAPVRTTSDNQLQQASTSINQPSCILHPWSRAPLVHFPFGVLARSLHRGPGAGLLEPMMSQEIQKKEPVLNKT